MFVLQKVPSWTWPVTADIPNHEGGVTTHRFRARFGLLPMERLAALGTTVGGTNEALREAVLELLDIVDEQQQPLAHTAELLEIMLANPWLRAGLIKAYLAGIAGQAPSPAALGN